MTLLSLNNITAFYGASQALFGVSLSIAEGEVVALLGRNGMGKSTTIKTICGMLAAKSGRVEFDGNDITTIRAKPAALTLAWIWSQQSAAPFCNALRALFDVDLQALINRFQEGGPISTQRGIARRPDLIVHNTRWRIG